MKARRLFIFTLALGTLVAPLAADAQQVQNVPRIGMLLPTDPAVTAPNLEAFRRGLRELGYVEGRNIAIEYRFAEGRDDRLPGLATELVRLKVDVIVTWGTPATLAAKNTTRTIPIVMATVGDPLGTGLVASLARPGGNITGQSSFQTELGGKSLELLREVAPSATLVAILLNPDNPFSVPTLKHMQVAAQAMGVRLEPVEVRDPNELDSAFLAMARKRASAVIVLNDLIFFPHGKRIAALAAKSRLPTIYNRKEYVEAGGLLSYGANNLEQFRSAATYVDKILKGAKPADLPVEQPTKFELVINLKTAKALGLTIPQSVLIRADEVIQ